MKFIISILLYCDAKSYYTIMKYYEIFLKVYVRYNIIVVSLLLINYTTEINYNTEITTVIIVYISPSNFILICIYIHTIT